MPYKDLGEYINQARTIDLKYGSASRLLVGMACPGQCRIQCRLVPGTLTVS